MEERQAFESKELTVNSKDWKQYEVILKSPRTEPRLISVFSLKVQERWIWNMFLFSLWILGKNVRTVFAKDLVQALYDIKPGVFRFPGGCIVEGTDEATRYEWKKQ